MTILVTGASGQLGSRIVDILLKNSKEAIIAGSRSVEKIKKGVEARKVDFDDSASTDEAFKNIDRLLIVSTDALAVPGLRLKQHLAAIASAKKNNVKHIVYTSLTAADNSPISFAPDHKGTEDALKASGISYTILRNNWYSENLAGSIAPVKASGQLHTSTENGKVAFISREDCAQVAAAIIANPDKYKNVTLDVTGNKAFSYDEIAALTHLTHVKVPEAGLRASLAEHGLPGFVIDLVATYEKSVAQGKQALTNNLVEELTGHKPKALEEYLKTL